MRGRAESWRCVSLAVSQSKSRPRDWKLRRTRSCATGRWQRFGSCGSSTLKDSVESERWLRVEELFHSALRVAADQRAGFLKNACQGDAKLCEEVESLLAYESSAQEFM